MSADLLGAVLSGTVPNFALLHRHEAVGGQLEVLTGTVSTADKLADLPLPVTGPDGPRHEALVLVPYRQLMERGFECHDDGSPLLCMTVGEQESLPLTAALPRLPDVPVTLSDAGFDIDDETYGELVRTVLAEEIGCGTGANFVIKRSFTAQLPGFTPAAAISLFRKLLTGERGAYWTFVVHTGDRTFVGATPERHVSLFDGTAVMNPVSGTLRYPPGGPRLDDVLGFLADAKETGELSMVVDEELKMMARFTDRGGRAHGPYLKEMASLAHTEYLIEGTTDRDVREILRETMFAPTVTGSPLESACRVIHTYEPRGRGYYSGAIALVSRDIRGGRSLDSAIMLRTAQIVDGTLDLGVGATLVRDSDPASEAEETHAKARGVLRALGVRSGPGRASARSAGLGSHPQVRTALAARNEGLAPFWFGGSGAPAAAPSGRSALVVDAEDTFTAMLRHQLTALGLDVEVQGCADADLRTGHDLVVLGPGPGDPRNATDPRVARLRLLARELLAARRPVLGVCLSHQVLGTVLGLDVVRRDRPNQGVQHTIDHFGRPVTVGFYNTFALTSAVDEFTAPGVGPVRVSRDTATGQVHALAGSRFRSLQFHPESILSPDGLGVLSEAVSALLLTPVGAV